MWEGGKGKEGRAMPIKPENRKLYPADWKAIRQKRLEKCGHKCEECGLRLYSVGFRDKDGKFYPNGGNVDCDASGQGQHTNGEPLTFAEAQAIADDYNDHGFGKRQTDYCGQRWFVVVLTLSHTNHDVTDNRMENLRMLCPRCHNTHDVAHRQQNAKQTRQAKREQEQVSLFGQEPGQ